MPNILVIHSCLPQEDGYVTKGRGYFKTLFLGLFGHLSQN
jgi:hypothetical protein